MPYIYNSIYIKNDIYYPLIMKMYACVKNILSCYASIVWNIYGNSNVVIPLYLIYIAERYINVIYQLS